MSNQPWMTPGGTISTSPTFNSTLREPTATPPPQPGPFGPPSGLFVLLPAVDNLAVNERRAAAGDDVIALGLIVVRDGALKCVRRRIGHLFSTRGRWGRSLGIATTGGSRCIASTGGQPGLPDRHHALLRAMNDAQLHAPAVADIDDPGILVTGLSAIVPWR